MRIAGIIAEYDPFTNGHAYHIEKTKDVSRADFVVAVMSGDFTQRGRPALLDKWTRSMLAVKNGADLVLELPFCYAASGAEYFARGAVGILEGLGIIDAVSFGSESGDIEELSFVAHFLNEEPDEYRRAIRRHLEMGISFPRARELAVNECLGIDAGRILKSPNNILAIEYLKHIAGMTPVTVKRESPYGMQELPDDEGAFASAGAVRKAVRTGSISGTAPFVPENVYEEIVSAYADEGAAGMIERRYFDMIRSVILREPAERLADIEGAVEGIENRMKKEIRMHGTLEEYASSLKSKRYTRTAIDRLLLHTAVGMTKEDMAQAAPYARVLAMNDNGAEILAQARGVTGIPVVTNINKYAVLPETARFDVLASDLYNIITGRDLYRSGDHVMKPFRFTC